MKLRPYQFQALKVAMKNILANPSGTKGRMVLPTGAGKTLIEAKLLKFRFKKNPGFSVHVVLSPRIMLCNQLANEYRNFIGNSYVALAFHSGSHEPDYSEEIAWKEEATTFLSKVHEYIENAKKRNVPLVLFSTYHSSFKLAGIPFKTLIADESQYCVAENFNESVRKITAEVKLFFTATERITSSDNGLGLNNESIYGTRWFYVPAQNLIDQGYIVPPRLHILYGNATDSEKSLVHQVSEIAQTQMNLTKETLPYSKILFATNGTGAVKAIEDNLEKLRANFPTHEIFTITSRTGAMVNGTLVSREEFLKRLKSAENCLIFHYDILSEGIDVDGITGVSLMRNMNLSKLLQTIGRAVRLYKPNPALKPQAWVSVPVINGNDDDKERVRQVLQAIRNGGYDISQELVFETKEENHEADPEPMEDAYSDTRTMVSNMFLEEVWHEIEQDEFWKKATKIVNPRSAIMKMFSEEEE